MTDQQDDVTDRIIVGLAQAPEFFVEGYRGAILRGGVVKLNLFANRLEPTDGSIVKHAVCVLTIPLADLRDVLPALNQFIEQVDTQPSMSTGATSP